MRTLFVIAALAAGLVSNGANADAVYRHHHVGAGIMRYTIAPLAAPTRFQSLYQAGDLSNDCEGQRVFGFCPVR